jgi:hypothetical protein
MSKPHLKYLRNEVIEDVTARRIREYEAKAGITIKLPVPIEKIVEQVLGLDFEWDVIEEQPGEQILGGLVATERKIILNEKHLALFKEKPGLERSTIGHEAGHWDIDIDRARLFHPTFAGFEVQPQVVKRHAKKADKPIEVLFSRSITDDRAYRLYKKLTEGQDTPRSPQRRGPLPVRPAHARLADEGSRQPLRFDHLAGLVPSEVTTEGGMEGMVHFVQHQMWFSLLVGGVDQFDHHDHRLQARYKKALEQLLQCKLLEWRCDQILDVTYEGYLAADEFLSRGAGLLQGGSSQ